jgi:hypothetical protein
MQPSCVRKLVSRWSSLVIAIGFIALAICTLSLGHTPVGGVRWAGVTMLDLPNPIPRLIDPLVVGLYFAAIHWIWLRGADKMPSWGTAFNGPNCAVRWGTALGILGSIVAVPAGIWPAVICTLICSAIIFIVACANGESNHIGVGEVPYYIFTHAVAVLCIGITTTAFQGTLAGLVMTSALMTVSLVTHFSLYFVAATGIKLWPRAWSTFERTMLTCDPEGDRTKC